MKKLGIILILSVVVLSGCSGKTKETGGKIPKEECIQACEEALERGKDLSTGPCLLDPMENSNWVCDVAHDPRQPVDNERENQCDAWHDGTAEHFIEVTPDCKFIQAN